MTKMKIKSPIMLYFNNERVELKSDGSRRYIGVSGENTFVVFGVDLQLTSMSLHSKRTEGET